MLRTIKKPPTPLQKLKLSQIKQPKPKVKSKPKLVPLPTLMKRADAAFSRYIRLRDSEYVPSKQAFIGECITSGKKLEVCRWDGKQWRWNVGANVGHYVTRGHKGLRFDERNCNLQSAYDNAWRDKVSMLRAYAKALDFKYGDGTAEELELIGREAYKLTRGELEQIIADSKEYVTFTLAHPRGYDAEA